MNSYFPGVVSNQQQFQFWRWNSPIKIRPPNYCLHSFVLFCFYCQCQCTVEAPITTQLQIVPTLSSSIIVNIFSYICSTLTGLILTINFIAIGKCNNSNNNTPLGMSERSFPGGNRLWSVWPNYESIPWCIHDQRHYWKMVERRREGLVKRNVTIGTHP